MTKEEAIIIVQTASLPMTAHEMEQYKQALKLLSNSCLAVPIV